MRSRDAVPTLRAGVLSRGGYFVASLRAIRHDVP